MVESVASLSRSLSVSENEVPKSGDLRRHGGEGDRLGTQRLGCAFIVRPMNGARAVEGADPTIHIYAETRCIVRFGSGCSDQDQAAGKIPVVPIRSRVTFVGHPIHPKVCSVAFGKTIKISSTLDGSRHRSGGRDTRVTPPVTGREDA